MSAPVPVLHVSYLGGLGGGETMWLSQIAALDRRAWRPYVLCGTPGAFVDELRAADIPVEVVPYRLPYFQYGWLPRVTLSFLPRLGQVLRERSIALVHCNDPESAFYVAPVARFARVPVIWTCGGWWHAERGWKSRFYDRAFARIITWTSRIRAALVAANPALARKTVVIPSGVDTARFAPAARDPRVRGELGIPADAPVIILLARYQSVKGHEFLLRAAPAVLARCPETRFLFVGDNTFATQEGESYRRAVLARIANDPQLAAHVVVAGFRRDIPALLNASDLLVCPSLFESYGMANLEAMACGLPVVSTNDGGPAETVVDGETGLLVPPRDPAALAAGILALLGDAARRRELGANARRRVLAHYTLADNVAALEQVYRETLTRSQARSPA